jgi:hypothetical protein
MQMSHANENGHSSMADQAEVSQVKIKIERIETEVGHNRELLGDRRDIGGHPWQLAAQYRFHPMSVN